MRKTPSAMIEEISLNGFCFGSDQFDDSMLDGLLNAFDAAKDSPHARSVDGDTYALRNILKAVPGVHEAAMNKAAFDPVRLLLGEHARPVKAILFDKTEAVNWNIRWHQDNVIAVKERRDVPGFSGWSEKVGIPHVRPPVDVLEKMLAARIHIDDCANDNGALKVIAGSHSRGRLSEDEIARMRETHAEVVCEAKRGQILFMRPLILHSSQRATKAVHRRVLHIEYAGSDLPGGLDWGE
jgi:ectoine hydroxylase-related dioxygenase (phytanoyl-CoA dioxygenase family)